MRTADVDTAEEVVSRCYEPHSLMLSRGRRLDARLNAVQIGDLMFGYLAYGAATTITLPPSENWYHVNIALRGSSRVKSDKGVVGSTEALASAAILLPHRAQEIEWDSDTAQFALRISRSDLEGHLAQLTGRPVTDPLDFGLTFDLTTPGGKGLLRAVEFVRAEWDNQGMLAENAQLRRQLNSLILTNLLAAAPGPHHGELWGDDPGTSGRPESLRRAIAFIHDHADQLPALADITHAAGIGLRMLQLQFKRELGRTPTQYLREVRLDGVRQDLLHPRVPAETVTDVAMRWGFYNLGRFSAAYRGRFGEAPSDTLLRSR